MYLQLDTLQIINKLISDGLSISEIHRHLVVNRVPSFSNFDWSYSSVRNAIQSIQDKAYRPNSLASINVRELEKLTENQFLQQEQDVKNN